VASGCRGGAERFGRLAWRLPNPMVLLAAGAVSLLIGEGMSAGIITAVVLLSVLPDQQQRAEAAAQRLSETVALRARVLRDGSEQEVDVDLRARRILTGRKNGRRACRRPGS